MREKTSFTNYDECVEAFVYQKSSEGHTPNYRLYFEGKTIWSYGNHFVMAKFINSNLVLVNENNYSVTTAKQKSILLGHLPRFIEVIQVSNPDARSKFYHKQNFESLLQDAKYLLGSIRTARDNKIRLVNNYNSILNTACRYSKLFKLGYGSNSPRFKHIVLTQAEIDKCEAYQQATKLRVETRWENERKRWEAICKAGKEKLLNEIEEFYSLNPEFEKPDIEVLDSWDLRSKLSQDQETKRKEESLKDFFDGTLPDYYNPSYQYLKIDLEKLEVKTTMFSRVKLHEAVMMYQKLIDGENLVGLKLDYFTVLSLDENFLTIGCHKIQLVHIHEVFKNYTREKASVSLIALAEELLKLTNKTEEQQTQLDNIIDSKFIAS